MGSQGVGHDTVTKEQQHRNRIAPNRVQKRKRRVMALGKPGEGLPAEAASQQNSEQWADWVSQRGGSLPSQWQL